MELKDYVDFATRVALRMGRYDPELESLANAAAWHAYTTYRDPETKTGNYTEEGWIARCTKQHVWSYWRSLNNTKRSNEHTDGWWEQTLSCEDEPVDVDTEHTEDWQILCEKYIEGWCTDVIARRHGWSIAYTKRRLQSALDTFTILNAEIAPAEAFTPDLLVKSMTNTIESM